MTGLSTTFAAWPIIWPLAAVLVVSILVAIGRIASQGKRRRHGRSMTLVHGIINGIFLELHEKANK